MPKRYQQGLRELTHRHAADEIIESGRREISKRTLPPGDAFFAFCDDREVWKVVSGYECRRCFNELGGCPRGLFWRRNREAAAADAERAGERFS